MSTIGRVKRGHSNFGRCLLATVFIVSFNWENVLVTLNWAHAFKRVTIQLKQMQDISKVGLNCTSALLGF